MKKFFAILGGIVAATSVLAIAAVILNQAELQHRERRRRRFRF